MSTKEVVLPNYHTDHLYIKNEEGRFEKYLRSEGDKFVATGELWRTIPQEEMTARFQAENTKLDDNDEAMLYDPDEIRFVFIKKEKENGPIRDSTTSVTPPGRLPNCS
jgi:3-dehydroquinate synthase class II